MREVEEENPSQKIRSEFWLNTVGEIQLKTKSPNLEIFSTKVVEKNNNNNNNNFYD